MSLINYISIIAVPFVIFYIVAYGFFAKIKVFDSFLVGCKEGINTVIKIFPTLVGLFLAISALRNSGILDLLSNILSPILNLFKIPSEILPLMLVRPISGSASTAVALDIMKNCGVDTIIRIYCFYNYGLYWNYFVYYCYLHKCYWNKENTLRSYSCTYCRYSSVCFLLLFFAKFCKFIFLILSIFVVFCRKLFLDFCRYLSYHYNSFYIVIFWIC